MSIIHLFVGTDHGLYRLWSDDLREEWRLTEKFFAGCDVSCLFVDPRSSQVFAGTVGEGNGASIYRSDDQGTTWRETSERLDFISPSGPTVHRVWTVAAGARTGELFVGTEDAGLFRSLDLGETWHEIVGLRDYPRRRGTGDGWKPGSLVHSIIADPARSRRLWVATSTAGVLRSDDLGENWTEVDAGIQTTISHGIGRTHKLVRDPTDRETLYLQHFEGLYRLGNGGDRWERIDQGLPTTFGFPAVATGDGDLFVAPLISFARRWMPGEQLRIFRSSDRGRTWSGLREGLPLERRRTGVLRDALTHDSLPPTGVYVGTTDGELFVSPNRGETWHLVAGRFGRITALAVATSAA